MKTIINRLQLLLIIGALIVPFMICAQPLPPTALNPNVGNSCPLNITLVLDESGSINAGGSNGFQQVRQAAINFITALNGTGSRIAMVRFATNSTRISVNGSTAYQTIDNAYITNATVALASYGTQGWTNWPAAFQTFNKQLKVLF